MKIGTRTKKALAAVGLSAALIVGGGVAAAPAMAEEYWTYSIQPWGSCLKVVQTTGYTFKICNNTRTTMWVSIGRGTYVQYVPR